MQESRIFPIIYHVSARPYHRSGASFLHQFIQICGALQLLYSVNECAWIAPYIPKVSNFNVVVLNVIDNFIQPIQHITTISDCFIFKQRFYFTDIGGMTYQSICFTHFLHKLIAPCQTKLPADISGHLMHLLPCKWRPLDSHTASSIKRFSSRANSSSSSRNISSLS